MVSATGFWRLFYGNYWYGDPIDVDQNLNPSLLALLIATFSHLKVQPWRWRQRLSPKRQQQSQTTHDAHTGKQNCHGLASFLGEGRRGEDGGSAFDCHWKRNCTVNSRSNVVSKMELIIANRTLSTVYLRMCNTCWIMHFSFTVFLTFLEPG